MRNIETGSLATPSDSGLQTRFEKVYSCPILKHAYQVLITTLCAELFQKLSLYHRKYDS